MAKLQILVLSAGHFKINVVAVDMYGKGASL
ncbi:hypothetical protein MESS4_p20083 [Mesorhizobium sp. STM 4661]|nr:hypothetical protein MESS4_p20083 [Mesorhizobium sp. STM 4661]